MPTASAPRFRPRSPSLLGSAPAASVTGAMPPPRRSYRPRPASEFAVAEADALISLPTDVLDDILNRVGPRDAVRTSALSRAWRRRWEALASLDLDFDDGLKHEGAVDSILLRCPGRCQLNGANILETLPCTFINLKSLTLVTHLCELPSILSTFCLLRNAPSLESLKIQVFCDYDYGMGQKFEANGEFQNAQCTDGMCAKLQFVDMTGIHLFTNEMSFIEVILSKARLLRTLSISLNHGAELTMSNEDGLKKLLNYKKASTHAEVIFEG
ncbi:uncharacterized protein LOC125507231 [Triticum urartu]|uniref:uncharacterized protein LOC125507231 n=1 Tax=Triticum urartu TaxID=4572 RepID=UPI002042DFF6|nr:uncharacterized protein LOC125507231 [Triticum urartu]